MVVLPSPEVLLATEWVLPSGLRNTDIVPGPLAMFPADVGLAHVAFHPLRQGAFVMDVQSHFHVPVTVGAKVLYREPILAMRLPLSGRAIVRNDSIPALEESAEMWNISLTADSNCLIDNAPGEQNNAIASVFTVSRLQAMMDGERCPDPIRRFLEGRSEPFGAAIRTSAKIQSIAQQIRANPYQGAMASLYTESKAYHLLAQAFTDLAERGETRGRILARDRQAALAARELLESSVGNPPRIEDLARQVGLSQRRLHLIFRELFGVGPLQYLTHWRLEQARILLDRGDLSVKQIAHLMGYGHVSSFTHAFVRQFGQSPTGRRIGAVSSTS